MSSFVQFPGSVTATIWNSTFEIVLRVLGERSEMNPMAARALRDNPIAGPIALLNLTSFSQSDLGVFIELMSELKRHASEITCGWASPQQVQRLPDDLGTLIQRATETLASTNPNAAPVKKH
jgi:hypothetical protein